MSPSTPIRLVALDLDGTLLDSQSQISPRTRQAIADAVGRGVIVLPCTGRPLASLPPLVAQLPGIRYAITTNGAAVWDMGTDPLGAVYSRYSDAIQRPPMNRFCWNVIVCPRKPPGKCLPSTGNIMAH